MKRRFWHKSIVFPIIFGVFLSLNANLALADGNQKLFLKTGYSYLLVFDKKVQRYSIGDETALKAELLTSIYTDKQEVLLKPLVSKDTNILVWTTEGLYNFDVFTNKEEAETAKIVHLKDSDSIKIGNPDSLSDLSVDAPPENTVDTEDVFNFEIDKPPVVKQKKRK